MTKATYIAAAAEGIMVIEISQTEKDKNYISLLLVNLVLLTYIKGCLYKILKGCFPLNKKLSKYFLKWLQCFAFPK